MKYFVLQVYIFHHACVCLKPAEQNFALLWLEMFLFYDLISPARWSYQLSSSLCWSYKKKEMLYWAGKAKLDKYAWIPWGFKVINARTIALDYAFLVFTYGVWIFLILSCSAVYSLYKQPFWLPEVKNMQSMPVEVILQNFSIVPQESCEVRLLLKFVSANTAF